ncbi:MAG: DUF4388 domain-containing protein [Deltaproteobacteria bacterium]|nr:DUF4388 domain-containing protein [Deltaproteobacteria bacterium]
MGLQGTLDTMDADELVCWLRAKPRSGVLTYRHAGTSKSVTVDEGKAVNASSTDPREYLGQLLIGFGWVSEDQLQAAFDAQEKEKALVGRILVSQGLLSEEQVLRALKMKVAETFLDIFLWDHGIFNFEQGVESRWASEVAVALDLKALHQEGLGRKALYGKIRELIPHNGCRLRISEDLPEELDPKSYEGAMVQSVRDGLPVADIILRFHKLEFCVLRTLHDMVQRGWLEVDKRELADDTAPDAEANQSAEHFLSAAHSALQGQHYDRALSVLARGLASFPYDVRLCEMYETVERKLGQELKREWLHSKRVPMLTEDASSSTDTGLGPVERYLLSRIDGKRSLRSIVMVSPLREVEALRAFQYLVKAGLVNFR